MSKVSRIDQIIGALVVILLLALLAVALVDRSQPAHGAGPATGRTSLPSSSSGPSSTTDPGRVTVTTASTSLPLPSTTSSTTPTMPVPGPVSAVGDSIMLDIQPNLQADIPGARVDGLVSRQFETGIQVVAAERASGDLGSVLVVELGTNGSVTSSDIDAMMQAASGVTRVVFVNVDVPRSWEASDNAALAAGVARYPGVAVLADWYALSSPHPEWFTPDQVHLEPAGAQALADLIARYA